MWTTWAAVPALDAMFDDVMRAGRDGTGVATKSRGFEPDVDLRADDDRVRFVLDVPGVKEEDLEITLHDHVLTVRGERRYEAGSEREQVVLGRSYGAFARSFQVPDGVDEDRLTARLDRGVLVMEMPKLPKAKPRRITVTGASASNGASNGNGNGASASSPRLGNGNGDGST